jgi:hypothetical protein
VKVKALDIFGEPVSEEGEELQDVYAEDVESELQDWLETNPNVGIEHVVQTLISAGHLLVTIFYRD